MLTIALSKGRILDDTLPLLAAAGIVPSENPDKSRKLIIPTSLSDVRLLIVRATDVPTYVEHGAADLGVAGKDVLMEYGGQGLYEPLDLRIANCKLMTAGAIGAPEPKGRLRVATKFVNVAKRYYAEQGRQVDVIKLYGSMELAPLVGLADKIIDVVDTGNTLRDTHRKRVHPGCTETDLCCHISNQNGNDRVISNGNKQWAQDHGKWKRFLSHSKNCSSKRKQHKQYRNQHFFCSLCLADQSDQSRFDRACPDHDTKCTTNYQQKCNDLDRRITDNSIKHVIKESAFAVTAE